MAEAKDFVISGIEKASSATGLNIEVRLKFKTLLASLQVRQGFNGQIVWPPLALRHG